MKPVNHRLPYAKGYIVTPMTEAELQLREDAAWLKHQQELEANNGRFKARLISLTMGIFGKAAK